MKICHFTSAHSTDDVRIFLKECQTLGEAGHDVYLVGKGESREEAGIHVVGCGNVKNRADRFLFFSKRIYKTARDLGCDVYHFHDPELLRYALKLKRLGKIVIFDSHEDVPAQILDKQWIPAFLRKFVSKAYERFETHVVKKIDAVVTATPYIADKFKGRAKMVCAINNYPKLSDIEFHDKEFSERESIVCYVGGVSEQRGEKIMLEAMRAVNGELIIAGEHEKETFTDGGKVTYVGRVDRTGVNDIYSKSVAGLVVLQPCANYVNSQPIKMYEYMAAGLPVIYSSFQCWNKQIGDLGVGIAVNSDSAKEVAAAINYLFENRDVAQEMGIKGRQAVGKSFSWEAEGVRLCELYERI